MTDCCNPSLGFVTSIHIKVEYPELFVKIANLSEPFTCIRLKNEPVALAAFVTLIFNPVKVTAALFHVCVIVFGVLADIVPAANVAVVRVGALERTLPPVPVLVVTPVPPLATGSVPVTWEVRLTLDRVPPRVRFPEEVTVPDSVKPLTVPVPPTEVTVPGLLVIVWYSSAVPAGLTANTWLAVPRAVSPVPPWATSIVFPFQVPLVIVFVIGLNPGTEPAVGPKNTSFNPAEKFTKAFALVED